MRKTTSKFSPEVRVHDVRLVFDHEHAGTRVGVPVDMAARLKALERENRE